MTSQDLDPAAFGLYHVVAINERKRTMTYMTRMPQPRAHAMVILSKINRPRYTYVRLALEQAMNLEPSPRVPVPTSAKRRSLSRR